MAWCEASGVDYVFGLARNERLVGLIAEDLAAAAAESLTRAGPARRFVDFAWRTLDSWSRTRRVVAKAEHLPKGPNPRFVVTSLPTHTIDARTLYENVYCPVAMWRTESRSSSSICSTVACSMGYPGGFFDLEERLAGLSKKGDNLTPLAALIEFEPFRPELESAVPRTDRAKGGRLASTDHGAAVDQQRGPAQPVAPLARGLRRVPHRRS